jgi:hypothetical protein
MIREFMEGRSMKGMRRTYIVMILIGAVSLVSVLVFQGLHPDLMGLAAQYLSPGIQPGTLPVPRGHGSGLRSGMLLVLGIASLMASGILWSLVNQKEEQ